MAKPCESAVQKRDYRLMEATEEDLGFLYGQSALTWEGVLPDEGVLDSIFDAFREIGAEPVEGLRFYAVSGGLMNAAYGLTGSNAYKAELSILSIPLDDFGNYRPLVMWRMNNGGRWFDDIVDNNAWREDLKRED